MKRLITAEDIINAYNAKEDIYYESNTIITAQARDVAKEKNVSLLEKKCLEQSEEVNVEKTGCSQKVCNCEKEEALSGDQIYKLLKAGIDQHIFTEKEIEEMMRGLDD